jgi:hypothetical protein
MPPLDRLPPLSDDLRDWLDGGRRSSRGSGKGLTRTHGTPVGEDAHLVDLGTRLEDLARLALTTSGDGASGVGVDLDGFTPALPGSVDPQVQSVLEYLYSLTAAGANQERHVREDFTFATVSPLLVGTQAVDEMIVRTEVVITTAFDGPTAALLLGSIAVPGLVFDTNELKPKRLGQYESLEVFEAPVLATAIRLTITSGGSSAGAGYVLQTYRKV